MAEFVGDDQPGGSGVDSRADRCHQHDPCRGLPESQRQQRADGHQLEHGMSVEQNVKRRAGCSRRSWLGRFAQQNVEQWPQAEHEQQARRHPRAAGEIATDHNQRVDEPQQVPAPRLGLQGTWGRGHAGVSGQIGLRQYSAAACSRASRCVPQGEPAEAGRLAVGDRLPLKKSCSSAVSHI